MTCVAVGVFVSAAGGRRVRGPVPKGLHEAMEGVSRPYTGLGAFSRLAPSDIARKGAFAYDSVDVENVIGIDVAFLSFFIFGGV